MTEFFRLADDGRPTPIPILLSLLDQPDVPECMWHPEDREYIKTRLRESEGHGNNLHVKLRADNKLILIGEPVMG
ncbi:hypothetical protein [Teredinibacter sp. KSP-S5-2]|uniref:hypothetical protein n=1 Tax=Teredinibacter sp. KSP-S5-2 TaxID=3034506 RepID=UPI0029351A80|nr:hypothetical protein [Teredinibacter sp. KSP-S5-2]WNO11421.1 hypothetical protein P5V12_09585 [Teredinibacter sp. KSP-S5-2]WNO11427.1 hypothetical protein P5V12_09615 [Teredinibacter sp. KSP-S5-2]